MPPAETSKSTPTALQEALLATRAGDREAFGKILKRFERVFLHAARAQMPDDLSAKAGGSDILQDTFVDAHRDFHQFTGTTEAELIAWLRCLFQHNFANFVRDYRRREKRLVSREVPLGGGSSAIPNRSKDLVSPTPRPEAEVMRREASDACQRVLAGLSAEHREVLRLRFVEGLTFSAIGASLGLAEDTVRKRLVHILAEAKSRMTEARHEPADCVSFR